MGSNLLAVIPEDRDSVEGKSPLLLDSSPGRGEALRYLRTNLQFVDLDHNVDCLLITSSLPAEGKTTTALGVADAIATAGSEVIVLEADLRHPSFARYLGIEVDGGLTDALVRNGPSSDLLVPCGKSGRLRLLTAGRIPPNPSELIGSGRMKQLIDELRSACDVLVIDAPPLLPVTDAAVLATIASGVVLVAQPGASVALTSRGLWSRSLGSKPPYWGPWQIRCGSGPEPATATAVGTDTASRSRSTLMTMICETRIGRYRSR